MCIYWLRFDVVLIPSHMLFFVCKDDCIASQLFLFVFEQLLYFILVILISLCVFEGCTECV